METRFLCLKTSWLLNQYHGEEWPPSPARAYQALVAGLMTGGNRRLVSDGAEEALRWLEQLPPPKIIAKRKRTLEPSYRIAVPNNDMDKPARAWAKGREEDTSKYKTMKEIQPHSLDADGPHVVYCWEMGAEEAQYGLILKSISECMHTLGWGRDMAYADVEVVEDLPLDVGELWQPAPRGSQTLGVPVSGFLDDLKASYQRFVMRSGVGGVNADPRPSVYQLERYGVAGRVTRPRAVFELTGLDPDRKIPYSYAGWRGQDVAAWVRHAANLSIQKDPRWDQAGEFVSGHVMEGDRNQRLSYVPLPSVGHPRSDGRIRRIAILGPVGASENAEPELIEYLQRTMLGQVLTSEGGTAVCRLAELADSDSIWLRYRRQARRWRTVTPVILHGFNTQRGQISLKKTDLLIGQAFDESGFPKELIQEFQFQEAPLVPNTTAAKAVWKAKHLRKRPAYHLDVTFREKVEGPMVIGIGRHYGLGLFAPVEGT